MTVICVVKKLSIWGAGFFLDRLFIWGVGFFSTAFSGPSFKGGPFRTDRHFDRHFVHLLQVTVLGTL